MTKLKEVCIINPKSPGFPEDLKVSFVPMPKIGENGEFDPSDVKEYREVKKGFTYFQNGDVLFAKITPCMENGKGAIANGMKNGVGFGSTEFHVLRPLADYISNKWLFYLLSWPAFRKEAEKNMTGSAGQKRVPKTFLEEYTLTIPALKEQQKIADVLDKIRGLISLRKQQLAKLDELVKARFVELFGDPVASENKRRLSEIGRIFTGNTPSMKEPSYYESNDIPFIKPSDLNESGVTNIEGVEAYISEKARPVARIIPPNAVLVTCIGTIGKIGITSRESCCNQQINFVVPNDGINSLYLAYCLTFFKSTLQNIANAPVVPIINKTQFSELEVPVFDIDNQNQFAAFVEQTDKSKLAIQQSLDKLETLKKSLMQKYFG